MPMYRVLGTELVRNLVYFTVEADNFDEAIEKIDCGDFTYDSMADEAIEILERDCYRCEHCGGNCESDRENACEAFKAERAFD